MTTYAVSVPCCCLSAYEHKPPVLYCRLLQCIVRTFCWQSCACGSLMLHRRQLGALLAQTRLINLFDHICYMP